VLEKHFDRETMEHVALMESEAETQVIITDEKNSVLVHSNTVTSMIRTTLSSSSPLPVSGDIVEGDWGNKPYVMTGSPIVVKDELVGNVYMI
ncbi:hypothetical protein R0J91_16040, partial [Micrococcus sp. SIMBA_131]